LKISREQLNNCFKICLRLFFAIKKKWQMKAGRCPYEPRFNILRRSINALVHFT